VDRGAFIAVFGKNSILYLNTPASVIPCRRLAVVLPGGVRGFRVGGLHLMKIVGRLREAQSAEEAYRRALTLQRQAERLNPIQRARGFVFRAKTWEELEKWRRFHPNLRMRTY
jgi:hypothetical protein